MTSFLSPLSSQVALLIFLITRAYPLMSNLASTEETTLPPQEQSSVQVLHVSQMMSKTKRPDQVPRESTSPTDGVSRRVEQTIDVRVRHA